ncbi:histidine phosphatase family protein [Paenibacillus alkalitolerans]|uniref:histidine phosphatase family protein n=1 Tax=Paenibacillus alkalitolerans TaxID=2799335 RepID=UPI0018F57DFB|nr:histidine phosphatase family protein [Paenibacillus alkalitolerans]
MSAKVEPKQGVWGLEIYFIRHAQGEHTVDVPGSLEKIHPALTDRGREQAAALRDLLRVTHGDVLVTSPTIRTLETSAILAERAQAPIYVTPLVGPRMFPTADSWGATHMCDYILSAKAVKRKFPQTIVLHEHYRGLTNEGLNRAVPERFEEAVSRLFEWIRSRQGERVFIVSHEGTITDYRRRLTGEKLTREDFLGDAGYVRLHLG